MALARVIICTALLHLLAATSALGAPESPPESPAVAVLCFHRFGPAVADSMTVRTSGFEAQIVWLQQNGYHIIPLRSLVDFLRGTGPAPPSRSVVITVDDGHRTVFSELFPLVEKYDFPVTLFIYPSAISNASYALTWEQLRTMRANKDVDVQSHTYWHPNFNHERRRLSPRDFTTFTDLQLRRSKARLEQEVGGQIDLLAWPFGLIGADLETQAAEAGYVAGFSIVRRRVRKGDDLLALPRFLITDQVGTAGLRAIVGADRLRAIVGADHASAADGAAPLLQFAKH